MSRTTNLALPLLSPAQAQKHVTVNEALVRMDAAAQLRIVASDIVFPPAVADEGAAYIIPDNAESSWAGKAGQIAVWNNGGWIYIVPSAGWRAWHITQSSLLMFDGLNWVSGVIAVSLGGAHTVGEVLQFDQVVHSGQSFLTEVAIPEGSMVLGVTGRVLSDLTGTLASWRVGVSGAEDRYGTGLGKTAGSYLSGLSSSPVTYYSRTPLIVGAEVGSFISGVIRFAVHTLRLEPPRG